ncbi:MAG: type III secretion system effector protein [Chlamydiae bacterium]|nr:type III secretion system effector protein [Chlamydiota bacterium]
MTTAAISSKPFHMPLVEEIRDFLDKLKKSKIFAIKDLCNGSLREKKDIKDKVKPKKNSFLTKIWNQEKDNWDEVGNEMEKKVLSHIIPLNPKDPFSGTDLLVFKGDYLGTLPQNGIRFCDYVKMTKLLKEIFTGKTKFKFDPSLSEKAQKMLMRDFTILMTRKTSRQLIEKLANGTHTILIKEGNKFEHEAMLKGEFQLFGHKITICPGDNLDSVIGRAAQFNRKKYKIPSPSFLPFAHELIHAKHWEENSIMSNILKQIKDYQGYTNQEERRTITGSEDDLVIWKEDPENWDVDYEKWVNYDSECEWTIHSEFGLPVREDHEGGGKLAPGAFSRKNYKPMLEECCLFDAEIDIAKIKKAFTGKSGL